MNTSKIKWMGISLMAATLTHAGQPASRDRSDWSVQLGVMGFAQTELLHTADGSTAFHALPLASVTYQDFYWKGPEAGYKWKANPQLRVTPFINLKSGIGLNGAPKNFSGSAIEADDMADGYRGIEDREQQVEAGLILSSDLSADYTLELEGRLGERGSSAKAQLKRTIRGKNYKWTLSPFIAARVLDADFVDYYFGISNTEATHPDSYKINSAYDPDGFGLAGSIGLSGMYRLNKHWVLISKLEGQTLSSEIADSPLVRKSENIAASFSAIYKF